MLVRLKLHQNYFLLSEIIFTAVASWRENDNCNWGEGRKLWLKQGLLENNVFPDCERGSGIFYWSFSSNHNLTIKPTKTKEHCHATLLTSTAAQTWSFWCSFQAEQHNRCFLLDGEESCVKIDYNKRPEMLLICWLCSHWGFVILAKKKSCKRVKYEALLYRKSQDILLTFIA